MLRWLRGCCPSTGPGGESPAHGLVDGPVAASAGGRDLLGPVSISQSRPIWGPRQKDLAALSACAGMTDSLKRADGTDNAQRLLEAAQRSDLGAQEELVRRYEPLVQRVVWKLRLPGGAIARISRRRPGWVCWP
jgi:hypothetical protein